MAPPLSLIFSTLILTILLPLTTSHSSSLFSFVYGGCSQLKYSPSDTAYITNLNSLLTSLVNSATYSSYNHFTVVGSSPNDVLYALYQCRGDLSMPNCASCISHTVMKLVSSCPGSCGAALQLEGCFVKYDNDSFVGREDKGVVFKRCGPPVPVRDNEGKMAARDAVLDRIVSGPGPYRVGGSKDVQAMAQCVGDQSSEKCQDCVGEAVKEVKMVCGMSGDGEVYLGKCYVKYTLEGGHGYFNPFAGSDKNRGVKTFALIIGLLAAITILIIFFTFICRVFGGSSK